MMDCILNPTHPLVTAMQPGEFRSLTHGFIIRESVFVSKQEEEEVERTWRERLFSLPWRPLKKTKLVTVSVPDPHVYRLGNLIVGHPQTIAKMRELWDA